MQLLILFYLESTHQTVRNKLKKNYFLFVFIITSYSAYSQTQGVGINEVVPEQTLHLGLASSTIRVEGLDETNNSYNLGSTNKDFIVALNDLICSTDKTAVISAN